MVETRVLNPKARFQPTPVKPPTKVVYFIQSTNADRGISGFGDAKKGIWVEVPVRIYNDIKNVINAAGKADCGWKVKTEIKNLEEGR